MDDATSQRIARQVEERRFGKFRGVVTDNQDPQKRGRVKASVPSVLGDQASDWALPCFPFGGAQGYGWFAVPTVGAQVWVEFEEGDLHRPLWTGTFHQQGSDVPAAASLQDPTTYLLRTPNGSALELVDKSGDEQLALRHPKGAEIVIDKNGTLTLKDAQGATLVLDADAKSVTLKDANGNEATLDASGVTVKDANGNQAVLAAAGLTLSGAKLVLDAPVVMLGGSGGEPVLKGTSFLTAFMSHTHPSAAGPTGPPIPTGSEMTALSSKVMTN
ncbi:MAG: phage baseplate assembly protein V [Rubrivivax sp.]